MNIKKKYMFVLIFLQGQSFSESNLIQERQQEIFEDLGVINSKDYNFFKKMGQKQEGLEIISTAILSVGGFSSTHWEKIKDSKKEDFYNFLFQNKKSSIKGSFNFLFNLINVSFFSFLIYHFSEKNKNLNRPIFIIYNQGKYDDTKTKFEVGLYGFLTLTLTHLFWRNDRYFSFLNFLKNNWYLITLLVVSYQTEYAKPILSTPTIFFINFANPFMPNVNLAPYGLKEQETQTKFRKILALMVGQLAFTNLKWLFVYSLNKRKIKNLLISLKKAGVQSIDGKLMVTKENRRKTNKVMLEFANSF